MLNSTYNLGAPLLAAADLRKRMDDLSAIIKSAGGSNDCVVVSCNHWNMLKEQFASDIEPMDGLQCSLTGYEVFIVEEQSQVKEYAMFLHIAHKRRPLYVE